MTGRLSSSSDSSVSYFGKICVPTLACYLVGTEAIHTLKIDIFYGEANLRFSN